MQFSFHTRTMQQELLCTDAFITTTNPPNYSGERWSSRVQPAEAESDILIPLRRSHDFLYNTLASVLIATNSLDIFIDVFHVSDTAFHRDIFVSFFLSFLLLSCVRSILTFPLEDLLLCSHVQFSSISTDFIPESQVEKVCRNCGGSHFSFLWCQTKAFNLLSGGQNNIPLPLDW